MNFLNPQYLYFLPVILIPLIIHLLFRKRLKEIKFSSLYLIKEIALKKNKKIKTQNILLLIIRTLLLLALLSLFLVPFTSNIEKFNPDNDSKFFIIFDNSPSTASSTTGFTSFEKNKANINKLLSSVPQNSKVYIKTVDLKKEFSGTSNNAKNFVEILSVSSSNLDDEKISQTADSVLSEDNYNNFLYYFTDGSENILNYKYSNSISKFLIVPEIENTIEHNNISIDSLLVTYHDGESTLSAYLSNTSENEVATFAEFFIGNNKVYEENIVLKSLEKQNVIFKHSTSSEKIEKGYIKLSADSNNEDNIFYFTLRPNKEIDVLSVSIDANISKYLDAVFKTPVKGVDFTFKNVDIKEFNSLNIDNFEVILIPDFQTLSDYSVSRLKQFTEKGKTVILFLSKNLDTANYNSIISQKLNIPQITNIYNNLDNSFKTIDYFDNNSPIFNGVFTKNEMPSSVEIYSHYVIENKGKNLLISQNNPIMVKSKLKDGNIFTITTGLSKKSSNLTENGFIVPLLLNSSLNIFNETETTERAFYPYNTVLTNEDNIITPSNVLVSTPDKNYTFTNETGFYTAGDKVYAVNSIRDNKILKTPNIPDGFVTLTKEEYNTHLENFQVTGSYRNHIFMLLLILVLSEIILGRKKG